MSTLTNILGTPTEPEFRTPNRIASQLQGGNALAPGAEVKPVTVQQHTPEPSQTGKDRVSPPEKKANPAEPAPASVMEEAGKQSGAGTASSSSSSEGRTVTYEEMFKQMNPYKPMTQEEAAREQKRQKRDMVFSAIGDGISALANLYFTTKGAPNAYEPRSSMTAKTRSYYDRLTKERQDNAYKYASGMLGAIQADDAAARDDRNWRRLLEKDRKDDERQAAAAAYRRERDRKADERYDDEVKRQKEKDKADAERWQKQFEQNAERIKAADENEKKRLAAEGRRLAREMEKDEVTFALGARKGVVRIPKDALNESNVSYVFSKLPPEVQASVQGKPVYGKDITGETIVVGYEPVDVEAMLIAIGANIEDNVAAQDALREISGQKPVGKKPNPMR